MNPNNPVVTNTIRAIKREEYAAKHPRCKAMGIIPNQLRLDAERQTFLTEHVVPRFRVKRKVVAMPNTETHKETVAEVNT